MTESNDCFCWTKEPGEPPHFSDWRVTLENGNKSVTYAVHRVALGFKIEYFKRIFLSSSPVSNCINNDGACFSEARDQHSKIALPQTLSDEAFDWTVEAFEILLAQCYEQKQRTEHQGSQIKDSRVFVAFHYLADYFQVEEYNMEDDSFKVGLRDRLNSGEADKLYQGVLEFSEARHLMTRIRSRISYYCVYTGSETISSETELAGIADLPLWLAIVDVFRHKAKKGDPVYSTREWSNNIAHFLTRKNNTVTLEAFEKLTDFHRFAPEAALLFLDMERKFQQDLKDGENNTDLFNDLMTSLQIRCVSSLLDSNLEESDQQNLREKAISVMAKTPPMIKHYLEITLHHHKTTKQRLDEACKSRDQLVDQVRTLKQKNRALKRQRHATPGNEIAELVMPPMKRMRRMRTHERTTCQREEAVVI